MGTSEGISRYKQGLFTSYSTEDGLGGSEVYALLEVQNGALWIGTNATIQYGVGHGLSRFNGTEFYQLHCGRWFGG